MRNGIYLHPFDRGEVAPHGGLQWLRELGFADAAMAAAYHAGRWLAPRGRRRVRFLEDGVVHFRPSAAYGVLQPLASSEVASAGPSPLEAFLAEAKAAGLRPCAWAVLFHNTRLGERHAAMCVRNAFGDPYAYALCPAQPAVQEYGVGLIADLVRHEGLQAIELEAAGFMGHRHGSHHDKSAFAGDRGFDFLMSFCFCDACAAGLQRAGVDARALRSRIVSLLEARLEDALAPPSARPLERLAEELGEGEVRAMLGHRRAVNRAFLAAARAAAGADVEIALQVEPDPYFTGSQMGQPFADVRDLVDEVIVTHYGQGPERIAAAWKDRKLDGVRARGAFWPKAPEFAGEGDVRAAAEALLRAGCEGVRIYHLGLLPVRTLQRVARALGDPGLPTGPVR
jgi:hypothetical protein